MHTKDDLSAANDGSHDENSHISAWASLSSELQHVDIQPVFDSYNFKGELVPAHPENVVMSPTDTLNHTDCLGLTYE